MSDGDRSVVDLESFVLKDQGQNCSSYRGVEQPGPPTIAQKTYQQNRSPNTEKETRQDGLCITVTSAYQPQGRTCTDAEMSQGFGPSASLITCQSCEPKYSSQEILLNSNPQVNSHETQSCSQPDLAQTLCQNQNCGFNPSYMLNVNEEFHRNQCTQGEFNEQSTDPRCRSFVAAQKSGRLSTFYAARNSGNAAASSNTSSQNLKNAETQTSKKEGFWFQLTRCVVGSESYRRAREREAAITGSVNSVSKIDKLSRVLFPLSYGLLNLWYWYSYYDAELTSSWTEPGFILKL